GTGYSSLEQLRTLPFDRLKIDRSFVSELGEPEGRSTIVDAIISLSRGLNMPITAEGIEDERILGTLKSMGQMKGQGYLYGRPETADQVRNRLRDEGLLIQTKAEVVAEKVAPKVPQEPAPDDHEDALRQYRGGR
ncbi:MAG: EAL domain-containing protein, partial [Pseudomonadota bacterium]